ncbi:hypothetical protein FOZ63_015742, partial [Perkinsus olseni]
MIMLIVEVIVGKGAVYYLVVSRESLAIAYSISFSRCLYGLSKMAGAAVATASAVIDTSVTDHGFTGRYIEGSRALGQADLAVADDLAELSVWSENCYSPDSLTRKTKLICTMGPSCWDVDTL